MFQHLLSALESLCGAMSSGDFLSIDPNAMNAGFNAMQNAQMQAAQNQLIQSNMNNPLVQQMYQSHRQQGGTLDFPTFCLRYAETGGFTPQGYANAMHSRQQIEAQDAASMNAYRQHSQQLQESTTNYRQTVQTAGRTSAARTSRGNLRTSTAAMDQPGSCRTPLPRSRSTMTPAVATTLPWTLTVNTG